MKKIFGGFMKMKMMTAKELIDKLDINTKEHFWDIIVDDSYYDENKTQTLNAEVKSWGLEYCLVDHFFQMFLIVHTVDYKEEE